MPYLCIKSIFWNILGLPTAGILTPSSSSMQDPNYALPSVPSHINYPYTEVRLIFCNQIFF